MRKIELFYNCKYFYKENVMTIISLGGNCAVTYQLVKRGLRDKAYPFDWCKVSMNQLISALENDFIGFDDVIIKKLSDMHLDKLERPTLLLTNRYKITFAHEILDELELKEFKNSLKRRIVRFRILKNPIFVRLETFSLNDLTVYDRLLKILDIWFVNYKFVLITKIRPDNPKIHWIQLDDYSSDWKYEDVVDWSFL